MSSEVLVSVCVPSLNLSPFIDERIQTILGQTYANLEILIYDSFSEDGSWEQIEAYARSDSRIKAKQIPREGLYQGLNRTLRDATGTWVYIAMGDDTMEPDCIEKLLVAALREPGAGLAHCGLTVIGEQGERLEDQTWESRLAPRFMAKENLRHHKREAPHDGVCAMALSGIYTSLTQLLIHRNVFDRVGYFPTDFGPFGDLAWSIKAGLFFDCVHVPDHLATWRRHPSQASQPERYYNARLNGELAEIVAEGMRFARQLDRNLFSRLLRCGSPTYLFGDYLLENMKLKAGPELMRFLLRVIFLNGRELMRFLLFGSSAFRNAESRFRMLETDLDSFGVRVVRGLHES